MAQNIKLSVDMCDKCGALLELGQDVYIIQLGTVNHISKDKQVVVRLPGDSITYACHNFCLPEEYGKP